MLKIFSPSLWLVFSFSSKWSGSLSPITHCLGYLLLLFGHSKCPTLCDPMGCSTISQSLLKLMSTESVMPSSHLILCHPLVLLPSISPSISIFSNEFFSNWFLASGGESIGASALASILPMNIQRWFPLGLTGLILQSRVLSRVFSSTTVWRHQFFRAQPFLLSNSHIRTWLLEKP